jgi:hypothetical protein
MEATTELRRRRFEWAGRFVVTIDFADDLTPAERRVVEQWLKIEAVQLQSMEGPSRIAPAQERAFADALAALFRPRKLAEGIGSGDQEGDVLALQSPPERPRRTLRLTVAERERRRQRMRDYWSRKRGASANA